MTVAALSTNLEELWCDFPLYDRVLIADQRNPLCLLLTSCISELRLLGGSDFPFSVCGSVCVNVCGCLVWLVERGQLVHCFLGRTLGFSPTFRGRVKKNQTFPATKTRNYGTALTMWRPELAAQLAYFHEGKPWPVKCFKLLPKGIGIFLFFSLQEAVTWQMYTANALFSLPSTLPVHDEHSCSASIFPTLSISTYRQLYESPTGISMNPAPWLSLCPSHHSDSARCLSVPILWFAQWTDTVHVSSVQDFFWTPVFELDLFLKKKQPTCLFKGERLSCEHH